MKLYHYWRSSSSWRVRWAFALKGVKCEMVAVNLLDDSTDRPEHRARNPLGYVPVLEMDDGRFLSQSTAIIEWVDETHRAPALLPGDAFQRAWIRQLTQVIVADTQPLQNLNATQFHSSDDAERKRWMQHWIRGGLEAYEKLVWKSAGKFSVGDSVTLADLVLIPQCYNAHRNDVSLDQFPTVARIEKAALATPECESTHPDRYKTS